MTDRAHLVTVFAGYARGVLGEWAYRALRISTGCDGGEWFPVGLAGIEQRSDSVVAEAAEPECGALHALDQIVGGFGWRVGDMGLVPGCDLVFPTQ